MVGPVAQWSPEKPRERPPAKREVGSSNLPRAANPPLDSIEASPGRFHRFRGERWGDSPKTPNQFSLANSFDRLAPYLGGVSQPLALGPAEQRIGTGQIIEAEPFAVVMAEVELDGIAMQMRL